MSDVPRNPFLLPPDGAPPTAAPPPVSPPRVPDAAPRGPVTQPSHYIAVPASVESGTHRITRTPPDEARPIADQPTADEAVAEETRVAAPAAEAGAVPPRQSRPQLILPDGTRLRLDGPLLLGRDPAGILERPDAQLLAITDPSKTVSKTHALLEPDRGGGVRVLDLFSTNGVAVDTAQGRTLVTPGGSGHAAEGSSILLGSFVIEVAAVDPDRA